MPTTQPASTAVQRLLEYVEAHEETPSLHNQITAISWTREGMDTTAPLYLDDVREATRALAEVEDVTEDHREAQYGIRFPNGETVWVSAADAVRFDEDGAVKILGHALNQARVDAEARGTVRLDNVVSGWGNGRDLTEFISQADGLAAAARVDSDGYLKGLQVVRRWLTVSVTGPEVVKEFLKEDEGDAGESPSS